MDGGIPPGGMPPRWLVDGGIPPRIDRGSLIVFFVASCDHDSHRDADTNKLNACGRPGERRRDVEHAVVAIAMDVDVSHYVGAASVAVDVAVVVAVLV